MFWKQDICKSIMYDVQSNIMVLLVCSFIFCWFNDLLHFTCPEQEVFCLFITEKTEIHFYKSLWLQLSPCHSKVHLPHYIICKHLTCAEKWSVASWSTTQDHNNKKIKKWQMWEILLPMSQKFQIPETNSSWVYFKCIAILKQATYCNNLCTTQFVISFSKLFT